MSKPQRLLWFIDQARRRHWPNRTNIVNNFAVSQDTAKRDIDYLQHDLRAPLNYDRSQRGYNLTDRSWQIPASVTPVDAALAIATARHLLHVVSPALAAEFSAMVAKTANIEQRTAYECAFEVTNTRSARHDPAYLRTLLDACSKQQRVQISFASVWSGAPVRSRELTPWVVQLHDDHLYVHGYCYTAKGPRSFSFSGITQVDLARGNAEPEPAGFRKKLLSGFGVGQGPLMEATVLLHNALARYASHEIWHPKQRDEWLQSTDDNQAGTAVLKRTFMYNLESEVVRRLLSCGGDVEVYSPLQLRRALQAAFTGGAVRNASDNREIGGRG